MSAFVKKYILNVKCILLFFVALSPALGTLFISALQSVLASFDSTPLFLVALEDVFGSPFIYLVALVLLVIFSIDLGHCIVLNIIQFVSTFSVIWALGGSSAGNSENLLRIVGLILLSFFVILHVIAVVIKIIIIKHKKANG